jgi:hypothetical protein
MASRDDKKAIRKLNWAPCFSPLTAKIVQELNKPLMTIQFDQDYQTGAVIKLMSDNLIETLNLAGPRESKIPGIYEKAKAFLEKVLI